MSVARSVELKHAIDEKVDALDEETRCLKQKDAALSGINEPGPVSAIEGSTQALATTAQLRNRRL